MYMQQDHASSFHYHTSSAQKEALTFIPTETRTLKSITSATEGSKLIGWTLADDRSHELKIGMLFTYLMVVC